LQLAGAMLSLFDPTVKLEKEPISDVRLVPLYRNAKVVGGILPGELTDAVSFSFCIYCGFHETDRDRCYFS